VKKNSSPTNKKLTTLPHSILLQVFTGTPLLLNPFFFVFPSFHDLFSVYLSFCRFLLLKRRPNASLLSRLLKLYPKRMCITPQSTKSPLPTCFHSHLHTEILSLFFPIDTLTHSLSLSSLSFFRWDVRLKAKTNRIR
jgi:hypothetical protein